MQENFLDLFKERGFFHQATNEKSLKELLETPQHCYIGFDCTAPTLHVGSLVQIMILRQLQKLGHKPIILLGGGTTRVGDPSGKDATRKIQTSSDIQKNTDGIKNVLEKFICFNGSKNDAVIVNNEDWLGSLNYIDFLRDIGSNFSVNRMLSFESVKIRLEREQNLSFLEFNYMILQAYDFVELYKKFSCKVQIGGSDQWGNIVNGIDLARRVENAELFGLTTPLITTASGAKMGKTANGAVWLTEDDFSSYDYWQFWRNTEDKDVGRFLRLFTELPISEIETLEKLEGAKINEAKIVLANEATKICHGEKNAQIACDTAQKTFKENTLSDNLPTFALEKSDLELGIATIKLLQIANLCKSAGEAKRLIKGGGCKKNDKTITALDDLTSLTDLLDKKIKISSGKKKHVVFEVNVKT